MALDSALCSEIIVTLGSVPLANYETPGTQELAEALAPLVAEHDAILMANHGVVTYGADLLTAYMNMETVEHFAKIALVTHLLGKQHPLSDQHVDKLREMRVKYRNHVEVGTGQRLDRAAIAFTDTALRSFSPEAEPHPRAEVRPQRRKSQHLVVVIIQRVIHVRVRRDVAIDGAPAAEIDARIPRGIVDGRNVSEQEVGVRTLSHCGDAKEPAPALPRVGQQQHARLLGTPQQRSSRAVNPRIATRVGIARRRLLNLGRSVGVRGGRRQMVGNPAAQHHFGALRHGAIEIHVLAGVGVGVVQVLDLVAKLIVEVHRAERHAIVEQRLQHAGFDGPVLFRLQVGIRQRGESPGDAKGLLEAGLLDSLRVAKVQAGAAEDGVSAQRQERQRKRAG